MTQKEEKSNTNTTSPPPSPSSPSGSTQQVDALKVLTRSLQAGFHRREPHFDLEKFTEILLKLVENLTKPQEDDRLKIATDLKDREMLALSSLQTLGDYYELDALVLFLVNFYKLRISKDRKGREELQQIADAINRLHMLDLAGVAGLLNPEMGMINGGTDPDGHHHMNRRRRFLFWRR